MEDRNQPQTREREIVDAFWNRDETAIEAFTAYDGGRCYRIALGITEDAGCAEECVSDLCLRLWNSIPPERPASLRAYACRIVRNLALNALKKQRTQKRSAVLVELDECAESMPEMDPSEIGPILNEFLQSQPRAFALIFMRRYFDSDSVKHIAQITGFREKQVSRILAKMRKELKKALTEGGVNV